MCHSDKAILDGYRVLNNANNKLCVIDQLSTVVTGLKEEIKSLKRKIKQLKKGKNRKLDGLGQCIKLQSEVGGATCI